MQKTIIILLATAASICSVNAGIQLHSSFVKDDGTFEVRVVDTETNEVIETKSFRHNAAGDAILIPDGSVPVEEEVEVVEEAASIPSTSSGDLDNPAVEADAVEPDHDGGSGNSSEKSNVGVWDAVKDKLEASQASLNKAIEAVQDYYQSITAETVPETVGTVEVPEVFDIEEDEKDSETMVAVSKEGEDSEPVLDKEAEVSLPK